MKPLVVGLAPNREPGPAFAGRGSSARRLERLFGVAPGELLSVVDAVNLSPAPAPDGLPAAEWRRLASLVPTEGRLLVACGRTVADALHPGGWAETAGWGDAAYLHPGRVLVLIPHPSGRSRAWNDPEVACRCTSSMLLARVVARAHPACWGDGTAAALTDLARRPAVPDTADVAA